jgi:hypothetical protein
VGFGVGTTGPPFDNAFFCLRMAVWMTEITID